MTDTPDLHTLAAEAIRGNTVRTFQEAADAVLAAVLPAHRRQVAEEIALAIEELGGPNVCQWTRGEAAATARRLASAAPETAPTPRHGDETAPAVPEATRPIEETP